MPDELIERAMHSADLCDEQGFHATAKSLRALAARMQDSIHVSTHRESDANPQHPDTRDPLYATET